MHGIGHYVTVSSSGLVVNGNNPWLAATSDRKMVDMAEEFPFGLLEIKAQHIQNTKMSHLWKLATPQHFIWKIKMDSQVSRKITIEATMNKFRDKWL